MPALCIAGLVGLLYGPSVDAPFTFDDDRNILRNTSIRWTDLSTERFFDLLRGSENRRPVANLTFALNYYFGGRDVVGYHVFNLLIHFANGLLVYGLARATLGRLRRLPGQRGTALDASLISRLSLVSALLFVAHPLQTQSVTYVVQRMNSLAAFFYLGALLLYVEGRLRSGGARRGLWAAAVLLGALALGSKENAATLPLAVWLYEWFFFRDLGSSWLRRTAATFLAPLLVVGFGIYLVAVGGPEWGYATRDFTMGERVLTQFRVVVFYLGLIAYPHPDRLSLLHDIPVSKSLLDPPSTAAALLLLLAILAAAARLARSWRLLSFAVLWFFLHLALESSILPLEMIYEHRTYLPMVGVAMLAPWALCSALGAQRAWLPIAVAVVAALGTATGVRNQVWRNEVTLWRDVVEKVPDNARAHHNLAVALARADRSADALHHLREAVRLEPSSPTWRIDLAIRLTDAGDLDEAERQLRRALQIAPGSARAHTTLSAIHLRRRDFELAARAARRAISLRADQPLAHYNAGVALLELGRVPEATRYLERAVALRADYPQASQALARARRRRAGAGPAAGR